MKDLFWKLRFNILQNYINLFMIYNFYFYFIIQIEKFEMFVANLPHKAESVIDIRNLKQALNHGLVLKKVILKKCIKFSQNAWLKPYLVWILIQETKQKMILVIDAVFGKNYGKCKKI